MKNRNHGLSKKEMELVKFLMAECESTGDIRQNLSDSLPERSSRCLKQKWTSISATRKILLQETTPVIAETATAGKQFQAITATARYPFSVTATVSLNRRSLKRDRPTDEIEQKIMAMYAKGMSRRDIEDTLREIYGSEISQGLISRITDKILPEVNEWHGLQIIP